MGIGPSSANQKVKATRAFSKATPRPEKQTASNEFSSFFFFFWCFYMNWCWTVCLKGLPFSLE